MSPLTSTLALLAIPLLALAAAPRRDALTVIMLALVAFLALVIDRYTQRYLDGQSAAPRYRQWFVATVAAAALLVSTQDLRVLALAWTASSLSLHQLLAFFADRPQAQVAAHKKFLLSRLADVVIYAAVYLLGRDAGSYDLAAIAGWATTTAALPTSVHVAGALLVAGVALRSAQLPFHGWLIQVMEAPTPVSALLHAGIVNIGGFVLIRLAPLIARLPDIQIALVTIGAITAVLAAIVTSTRISVKVALAWSTAAQMGFMLVECGLGAWELALLHLVAHSCYKAHAFLNSGSVVAAHTQGTFAVPTSPATLGRWIVGALLGSGLAVLALSLVDGAQIAPVSRWFAAGTLAMALAPLFVAAAGASRAHTAWRLLLLPLAVALMVAAEHAVLTRLPLASVVMPLNPPALAIVLVAFGALFAVQVTIAVRPFGTVARTLHPLAFAGFHLDALFTRATFLLWPPRVIARGRMTSPTTAALTARSTH